MDGVCDTHYFISQVNICIYKIALSPILIHISNVLGTGILGALKYECFVSIKRGCGKQTIRIEDNDEVLQNVFYL